jgi:hypothetical protein
LESGLEDACNAVVERDVDVCGDVQHIVVVNGTNALDVLHIKNIQNDRYLDGMVDLVLYFDFVIVLDESFN